MNIRLCRKKGNPTRKGKYLDKQISLQLVDIGRGVRAYNEKKYAKSLQYLEKKALNPKATDRIKLIVGTSYTEIKIHEKEATELLKSIIQKYKDEPKNERPNLYNKAMLEYAKIQLRNELIEFAIYLLEDITSDASLKNIEALTELAKAYDMQAQELRSKDKIEESLEIEKKAEEICKKIKEISKDTKTQQISEAKKLLAIFYIRQGKMEEAKKELAEVKENIQEDGIYLFKKVYFKEESEEDVNKRIERIEKKLEAIENGEEEEKKEYARELNVISRLEYYEELAPDVKVSNGIDIFTGYKMYEYPKRGIIVIDKIFNTIKENQKIVGITYVFPQSIKLQMEMLSRNEIIKELEKNSSVQKQEHRGDYYNLMQEKMKRAELEGLVTEEKELKEKEVEINQKNEQKEESEEEGEK